MRKAHLTATLAALVAILVLATAALAANFQGTDGNDTYAGTPESDVVIGKGGNDTLGGAGANPLSVSSPGSRSARRGR